MGLDPGHRVHDILLCGGRAARTGMIVSSAKVRCEKQPPSRGGFRLYGRIALFEIEAPRVKENREGAPVHRWRRAWRDEEIRRLKATVCGARDLDPVTARNDGGWAGLCPNGAGRSDGEQEQQA